MHHTLVYTPDMLWEANLMHTIYDVGQNCDFDVCSAVSCRWYISSEGYIFQPTLFLCNFIMRSYQSLLCILLTRALTWSKTHLIYSFDGSKQQLKLLNINFHLAFTLIYWIPTESPGGNGLCGSTDTQITFHPSHWQNNFVFIMLAVYANKMNSYFDCNLFSPFHSISPRILRLGFAHHLSNHWCERDVLH